MTNEDYSKVPPPHLLKKFSEQAREDSQKRGHPGYCKTFAKLCIDWAFQEAAMDDLRVASAEVSGVELNSQPSPNHRLIRSFDITPPPELVEQWRNEWIYNAPNDNDELGFLATRGAQWGADQELEACVDWISKQDWTWTSAQLRAARRPKPSSLKEQALEALAHILNNSSTQLGADTIRRALEQLPDHE
jgi:hypothetical protein